MFPLSPLTTSLWTPSASLQSRRPKSAQTYDITTSCRGEDASMPSMPSMPLHLKSKRPNHGPTQVSNLINLFVDICLLQFCKTVFTCFWSHSRAKDHVYIDFIFPSSVVLSCDYPATLSTHVHALDVNTLLVGVMLSNLWKLQIWKKNTENKASLKTRYSCYTSKSRMTEESCLRTRSLSIDVVTSWSSNRLKKIEVIAPELPIWHVGSVYSLMWKKS